MKSCGHSRGTNHKDYSGIHPCNMLSLFVGGAVCTERFVGSQFLDKKSNPGHLQQKCGVLTTGPPGNSYCIAIWMAGMVFCAVQTWLSKVVKQKRWSGHLCWSLWSDQWWADVRVPGQFQMVQLLFPASDQQDPQGHHQRLTKTYRGNSCTKAIAPVSSACQLGVWYLGLTVESQSTMRPSFPQHLTMVLGQFHDVSSSIILRELCSPHPALTQVKFHIRIRIYQHILGAYHCQGLWSVKSSITLYSHQNIIQ